MKKFLFLFVLLAVSASLAGCGRRVMSVKSPDDKIELTFALDKDGSMSYNVVVDGKPFLDRSSLGMVMSDSSDLRSGFIVEDVMFSDYDETWTQRWGENKSIRENYNEMSVLLRNGGDVRLTMRFRLFDDGLGFRYEYEVPADSLSITDELTSFHFHESGDSWTIPSDFDTYELLYRNLRIDELADANTPATFRSKSGIYSSIHEAALYDFPEMNLHSAGVLEFKADLAPLPDGTKARVSGRFKTPWRTVQIARKAIGLINSGLILNLNEPCKIEDTSWIKPMKYVGVWWGMHLGVETWTMGDRHGATTDNAKRYIDFAAANNIQGVLFEGWNEGWENWGGNQAFDYMKPYADFDIVEIARYAKEKGIEIIGHHETGGNIPDYEAHMADAMKWYSDLGIHNLKTGYAGGMFGGYMHQGQYGVEHYQKVVETAARYKMTLDVHEPIKETGIRRTWPNMMTREGGRSMEWNAWSEGNPPSHYEMLPFTRLLSGPMDYTPGTFDILLDNSRNSPKRKSWNGQDKGNSRVNTTIAKQLANWVILYSPLQMASDMIENYEGHPAFQFFRDFNADCDRSIALAGEPGEFVAIVRQAGDNFYLGATTDENPRKLKIKADFLTPGVKYKATIYADGDDAHWKTNPTSYRITEKEVDSKSTLKIVMAAGGGQAITFKPLK